VSSSAQIFPKIRYELSIGPPAGSSDAPISISSDTEPNALRVVFQVRQVMMALWSAVISVYNLNEQTASYIIGQGNSSAVQTPAVQQGLPVTLSAGYYGQGANYGQIWDGNVIQVAWERENQTDFKLTLNCLTNLDPSGMARNPLIYNSAVALSQRQIIENLAASCFHPIPLGTITDNLNDGTLPRGKVMFGSPRKYLNEHARNNNTQFWFGGKGALSMSNLLEDLPDHPTPDVTLTPMTGIIGTPRQIQGGVTFRCTMNPNIYLNKPPRYVKLDQTQITQLLYQYGEFPGILSQSGVYAIIDVSYSGDTRGQDWYTDATGMICGAEKVAMTTIADAYAVGG
jgi:hypothetical protein